MHIDKISKIFIFIGICFIIFYFVFKLSLHSREIVLYEYNEPWNIHKGIVVLPIYFILYTGLTLFFIGAGRIILLKSKRPFCKEDIQKDAIKCKHCGEWLKKEVSPTEKITSSKDKTDAMKIQNGDKNDELKIEKSENNKTMVENIIELKDYDENNESITEDVKTIKTEKPPGFWNRYGWGWLIFLFSWGAANRTQHYGSEGLISLILLLACYFYLRNRLLIGKFDKMWKVSFVSGMLAIFIGGFLGGLLIGGWKNISHRLTGTSQPSLQDTVKELNKKMPIFVDSETRIDSVSSDSDKKMTYHETLINYSANEIDSNNLKDFVSEIKTKACATSMIKDLFKEGVSV